MITVHYFAAARAAAGVSTEEVEPQSTLSELLDSLAQAHTGTTDAGMSLAEIFPRCSFLIDGKKSTPEDSLTGAQRVDVLPPFAGG